MASNVKQVFVVFPPDPKSRAEDAFIQQAITEAGAQEVKGGEWPLRGEEVDELHEKLKESSIVIANIRGSHPYVMYTIGYARANKLPIIEIYGDPEDLMSNISTGVSIQHRLGMHEEFNDQLIKLLKDGLRDPSILIPLPATEPTVERIFISYSRRDAAYLDRLRIHLHPLTKGHKIDLWDDSRLRLGDRFKNEIRDAINRASAAILLVSADFLASDFIENHELPQILRKAEEAGKKIIPVIVGHCQFPRDERLNVYSAANNPERPLADMDENEREQVYAKICEDIERSLWSR